MVVLFGPHSVPSCSRHLPLLGQLLGKLLNLPEVFLKIQITFALIMVMDDKDWLHLLSEIVLSLKYSLQLGVPEFSLHLRFDLNSIICFWIQTTSDPFPPYPSGRSSSRPGWHSKHPEANPSYRSWILKGHCCPMISWSGYLARTRLSFAYSFRKYNYKYLARTRLSLAYSFRKPELKTRFSGWRNLSDSNTNLVCLKRKWWQTLRAIWKETYIQAELRELGVVLDLDDIIDSQTDHHVHDDDGHHEDEGDEDEAWVGWERVVPRWFCVLCLVLFWIVVLREHSLEFVFSDHHHKGLEQRPRYWVKCKLEIEIFRGGQGSIKL